MPTIREKNKAEGKLCGNCAHGGETCDPKQVYCHCPKVEKPHQNAMNWRRKSKGGCAYWRAADDFKTEMVRGEGGAA